jgi:hypothetical protein
LGGGSGGGNSGGESGGNFGAGNYDSQKDTPAKYNGFADDIPF